MNTPYDIIETRMRDGVFYCEGFGWYFDLESKRYKIEYASEWHRLHRN